jgi:hypothetical protein
MCVDAANCGGYCPECVTELRAEVRKLRAENKRLQKALEIYGDHHIRCASEDDFKCDCGFDEALRGESGDTKCRQLPTNTEETEHA